jgi:hypothetical protein
MYVEVTTPSCQESSRSSTSKDSEAYASCADYAGVANISIHRIKSSAQSSRFSVGRGIPAEGILFSSMQARCPRSLMCHGCLTITCGRDRTFSDMGTPIATSPERHARAELS